MTGPRSTPLYRLVIEALEARRRELGWTFAVCDAKAGLQNGYTAKMFRPDTPSGRIARWETVDLLVCAMYAGTGFRLFVMEDKPLRFAAGAPTPTLKLLAALAMAGLEGRRALKVLVDAGFEITPDGAIVMDQRATNRRENRRRKTRETIRTKVRKDAQITAAQY